MPLNLLLFNCVKENTLSATGNTVLRHSSPRIGNTGKWSVGASVTKEQTLHN